MEKTKKLPSFLKEYFWDVEFNKLDGQKYPTHIIARILDRGDEKAIRWLVKNYPRDLIKKTLFTRRGLSLKTANFWTLFLGLDKRKVLCLQKPYLKMRQTFWPY